jgi:DNA-directed RNA polymerase subunit L
MTTFTFKNEDHTLGNLLRDKLLENEKVDFAAYKAVHPLKREIQVHIETSEGIEETENEDSEEEAKKILHETIEILKKDIKKLREKS